MTDFLISSSAELVKTYLDLIKKKRGKNEKENLLSLLEPDDLVKYASSQSSSADFTWWLH